jgi:RNA polymerase sigma factor (sigma-70 family)
MRYARAVFGSLARRPAGDPASADDPELLARFAADRDEAAFAALVGRYGPMVLGACRRVLGDAQLAEDAFQATFLVLARRAGRLGRRPGLGGWLHVVARRVALRAVRGRTRRVNTVPFPTTDPPAPAEPDRVAWDELLLVLDEELERLPAKYRDPVVACYVRGRTQDEAARDLGWSLSTLRRRLEAGRELLRSRMTGRGATLSAALFAGTLGPTALAVPPERLTADVLRQATGAAAVPAVVAELVKGMPGVSRSFGWLLGVGVILSAGGVVLAVRPGSEPHPNPLPPPLVAPPVAERAAEPPPPGAVARLGSVRLRHGDVKQAEFVAGGRVLTFGGGVLRQWDAATGREVSWFGSRQHGPLDRPPVNNFVHAAGVVKGGRSAYIVVVEPDGAGKARRVYELDLTTWRFAPRGTLGPPVREGREWLIPSPDGRWVAEVRPKPFEAPTLDIAAEPGTLAVHIHDLAGAEHRLEAYLPASLCIAFSPDGRSIITGDDDHRLRVWTAATGKLVRDFGGGLSKLEGLSVSPDGRFVATCGLGPGEPTKGNKTPDPVIRVWDIIAGTMVRELAWGARPVGYYYPTFLRFTPDGKSVVATRSGTDRPLEVVRWSAADGAVTARWAAPGYLRAPSGLSLNADGTVLAVAEFPDTIRLFELGTGKAASPTPDGHDGGVTGVMFTPEGREVHTTGADATLRTWDAATGRLKATTKLGPGDRRPVPFTPGAKHVVSAADVEYPLARYTVREAATGTVVKEVAGHRDGKVSADGKTFAFVTGDKPSGIRVWDLDTLKELHTLAQDEFQLRIYLVDRDRLVTEKFHDVTFHDLAAGRSRNVYRIRGVGGDGSTLTPPKHDYLARVALAPDGNTAALVVYPFDATEADGDQLVLVDTRTGRRLLDRKTHTRTRAIAFSPDGSRLAVGGAVVTVYDTATGRELKVFDGHTAGVTVLAFSPDGTRLVSGSGDGTAVIWDVGTK